jgi:outer membrane lipoprotein-sorting protein
MLIPPRRPVFRLSALCLLALSLLPWAQRTAQAYILPADFLCRLVSDSHKNSLKDATLTLSLEVPEGMPPQEERLYLKRPERMRFVAAPQSQSVIIAREAQQVMITDNKQVSSGPTRDLLAVLMFPKGRDLDETSTRMLQALASVGVDTNLVTLARHADGVAYVIGAHVWEPEKPQVWIDKASFVPVRMRVPIKDARVPQSLTGTLMRETRLLNYAAGLPRLIETYDNDVLIRRSEVTQVAINQNLPESLFELREPRAIKP